MKEGEMPDKKRKFHAITPNEDDQYANSCVEGDHERLEPGVDEPDFREEPLEFEDDPELIDVDDPSETVCCICDNGGDVICCDGPCMRSFHVNKDAGGARDCDCSTLGLNKAEAERMDLFLCPNCKFKEHQCYICNKLGCSNEAAGDAQEVFVCDSALCGHFYHADCVAKMLLKDAKKAEQDSLAKSIRLGKGFVCPMHKCWKCGRGEDKETWDFQFGVCRRCPRVWHRKCFPKSLRFKEENDKPQRAWEGLLSDRVLIYCIEHKIIRKLCTPARTQAVFPDHSKWLEKKNLEVKKKKRRLIKLHQKEALKVGVRVEKKPTLNAVETRVETSSSKHERTAVYEPLEAKLGEAGAVSRKITIKQAPSHFIVISDKNTEDTRNSFMSKKGSMEAGLDNTQDDKNLRESKQVTHVDNQKMSNTIEQRSYQLLGMPQLQVKWAPIKPVFVDNQMRSMIKELVSKTKRLITLESIHQKHNAPFCYKRNLNNLDKKYSIVKIESIMKGIRKAVETLESSGSMEDAKAQCAPGYIKFLEGCKKELRVFLAPFLHGARYTPFGRHFTQIDKLEQIVNKLCWYVQNGDMVVDFCCGSNDFSLLMKAKLDKMGKNCYYKNFDIIQSQHSFNFVKKDWFEVVQNELAEGNRLVIGLNPPFGVKGRLANLFIDHALNFRPKILVLIVPKETERLDRKPNHYDLIWQDLELLKGNSFYLPGSVDIYGKPLTDWNVVPPPLSLWSRPDWTARHKQIALDKGHGLQDYHPKMAHYGDINQKAQERKQKSSGKMGPRSPKAIGTRRRRSDPMIMKNMPEERSCCLDANHGKFLVDGRWHVTTEHFNKLNERHGVHDIRNINHEQHETGSNSRNEDLRDHRTDSACKGGHAYKKPPDRVHDVHESTYYNAQLIGGTWLPGFAPSNIQLGGNSHGFVCEGYPIGLGQLGRNVQGPYPLDPCKTHPMDMAQLAQKFNGMASGRHSMDMVQPAAVAFERPSTEMAPYPPEDLRCNYGPPGRQYIRGSGCENFGLPMPPSRSSTEHQQHAGCHQNDNYRIV